MVSVNEKWREFKHIEINESLSRDATLAILPLELYEKLQKENERLKEALNFYAERRVYRTKNGGHIENKNLKSLIGRDCGRVARNALGTKKEGE